MSNCGLILVLSLTPQQNYLIWNEDICLLRWCNFCLLTIENFFFLYLLFWSVLNNLSGSLCSAAKPKPMMALSDTKTHKDNTSLELGYTQTLKAMEHLHFATLITSIFPEIFRKEDYWFDLHSALFITSILSEIHRRLFICQ